MSLTAQGDQLPVVVRHHLEVMCGSGGKAGEWRAFQEPRPVWRHVASTTVAGWLDAMNLIARWCPARVPDNAPVSSQAIVEVTLYSTTAWYWFTPYGALVPLSQLFASLQPAIVPDQLSWDAT